MAALERRQNPTGRKRQSLMRCPGGATGQGFQRLAQLLACEVVARVSMPTRVEPSPEASTDPTYTASDA